MRSLTLVLTITAVIFFVWQFLGKKGDKSHVLRGISIGILSILVVLVNTISISNRGYVWDTSFVVHTILGSIFFISLTITCIVGYLTTKRKGIKTWHRLCANTTAFFFFLTLLASVFVRLAR